MLFHRFGGGRSTAQSPLIHLTCSGADHRILDRNDQPNRRRASRSGGHQLGTYIMLNQHVGDRFSGVTGISITAPSAAVTAAIVGGRQARDHRRRHRDAGLHRQPGAYRRRVSRPAPSRRTDTRQDHSNCLTAQHSRGNSRPRRTSLTVCAGATTWASCAGLLSPYVGPLTGDNRVVNSKACLRGGR